MEKYYTYIWLDENGVPYYVGKGSGNRAFTGRSHCVNVPSKKAHILLQYFPTEEDAYFAECFLIAYYGRRDIKTGCLFNRTDGGENPPKGMTKGKKLTLEHRAKLSAAKKGLKPWLGKKHTPESRLKMRLAHLGKKLPEEQKIKIGLKSKGNNYCRGKIAWNKGIPHSEEMRAKLRAAWVRRKATAN